MDTQPQSREALIEFLDYLADKGLMEKNTVLTRKAAATKILGILDDVEAKDVTGVDLEDVVSRFQRLHGRDYTPVSLISYKSRLRSALDDFRSYLSNPLAFRPSVQSRARIKPKPKSNKDDQAEGAAKTDRGLEPMRSIPLPSAAGLVVPIPIRPNLTIHIQGLPFDLTEAEARKIAAVITAMAQT
jgi:hypothetical protein